MVLIGVAEIGSNFVRLFKLVIELVVLFVVGGSAAYVVWYLTDVATLLYRLLFVGNL